METNSEIYENDNTRKWSLFQKYKIVLTSESKQMCNSPQSQNKREKYEINSVDE